jgi:hypothetical protein
MLNEQVVIFEGPDMTGKTNIAIELSRKLKLGYFKNSNELSSFNKEPDYFKNVLKYGVPYLVDYITQTSSGGIFDRQYPTEWVYSKAFKRDTCETSLRTADNMFADLGAKIIICRRTDYENIFDDRFPDSLNPKKLKEIDSLYCEFSKWTNCETYDLIVDDYNIERELYESMRFICS